MASHRLTTYIARNPPDAVIIHINIILFISLIYYFRKIKVKQQQQHQKQKQKENQKVRKMLKQLVQIEIRMIVQLNKMENQ